MPTLTAKQNGNYKVNGYTSLHVNVQPGGGGGTAASISYDNTISALTATNVQDAIDELASDISSISVPQPTTTTPAMDGVAAVGSETNYARGDHVHPSDTSRVPTTRTVNGYALSSNITLTASDVGALPSSTTIPSASSSTPLMDGTASTGSEDDYARGDHRHPSDTTRVPTSRTVNGHALTDNVSVTMSDIGLSTASFTGTLNSTNCASGYSNGVYIAGLNLVVFTFSFTAKTTVNTNAELFTIPSAYRPSTDRRGNGYFKTGSGNGGALCYVKPTGSITQGLSTSCTGGAGTIAYVI